MSLRLFPVTGKQPAPGVHWPTYEGLPPPDDQPAGWAIPPGVLVVDIDGEEGFASVADAAPPLPWTPLHWDSLSGRGQHHVYSADAGAKNRRVLAGVDVKTSGGYVVVPPAGRAALSGEWSLPSAPRWAYERRVPKAERPAPERKAPAPSADGWRELVPRTSLEERCERVANAPEGERNETLNREAYLYGLEHGEAGAYEEMQLVNAGIQAGLDPGEASNTVTSGLTRGIEEHVDPLDGARRAEHPQVVVEGETPVARPRPYRTDADILALPEPSWLLPGRIVSGGINLLVGHPKSGKSVLSLAWAKEVACSGKRVLYVPAEHEQQFKLRLMAYYKMHGAAGAERTHWWYEEQVLRDDKQHADLAQALMADPVDLVVLDTMSAASGGFDENDAGSHVDVAERAAAFTACGAAVLLVHHTGHDKTRVGGSAAQMRRPLVYSVLERDDKLSDQETGEGWSKLTCKGGRFAGGKDQWYRFSKVPLYTTEDGDWSRISHDYVCEPAEPPAYGGEPDDDGPAGKVARHLAALVPGTPIPTIRALMDQTGVSYGTAQQALKYHKMAA